MKKMFLSAVLSLLSIFCFSQTKLSLPLKNNSSSINSETQTLSQADEVISDSETEASSDSGSEQEESTGEDSETSLVPYLLNGIWYNQERYIVFNTQFTGSQVQSDKSTETAEIPQIVLRTFYTWYDDRAAESKQYTELTRTKTKNTSGAQTDSDGNITLPATARDRNDTTALPAEEIKIKFIPIDFEVYTDNYDSDIELNSYTKLTAEKVPSGAWLMKVQFDSSRDIVYIPVAVIGNNLYLDFLVRKINESDIPDLNENTAALFEEQNTNSLSFEKDLEGLWQDYGSAKDLQIRKPVLNKELLSYYVGKDCAYPIRFWKTDMDYNADSQALIDDGENKYHIAKHFKIGEQVYTCVMGRRTLIRNLKKVDSLPEHVENSVVITTVRKNSDGTEYTLTNKMATIVAFGKPYMTLTDGSKTIEQLVVEANQRRKPLPAPLFPPHGVLDFHWDIIKDLPVSTYNRVLSIGKQ